MAIETNEEVAGRVRGIAAERKVSHAQLADLLHVSRMSMSRRLSGATPFAPEELIELGKVLRAPVAAFFGEVDIHPTPPQLTPFPSGVSPKGAVDRSVESCA